MTPPPPMGRRFIPELRRRGVLRTAGVYAAAAFVALQAADLAVEPLELPGWTMKLLWVLALVGFPVAVALAWAFDLVRETPGEEVRPGTSGERRPAGSRRLAAFLLLGLGMLVFGAWGVLHLRPTGPDALDANVVAVLPFRTSGADPSLAYLSQGMVDLLAAKLTGEGGPRAVDPRALLAAWARRGMDGGGEYAPAATLELAAELGAGRLLTGSVVGSAPQLTLSAALVDARTGRDGPPVTVAGPADSLSSMVDRLAALLLSIDAGEAEQRLSSLTSTTLPALRAYLDGQRAYRAGRFGEAIRRFGRALEEDSTFALAAIGRMDALSFYPRNRALYLRSIETAWSLRDRLSIRDRALLEAQAGAGYPDRVPDVAEDIALYERAVRLAPESPSAWHRLGEALLHEGTMTDRPDVAAEAFALLRKAVQLDSTFAPPMYHLLELAAARGDTAEARRVTDLLLGVDSAGESRLGVRWLAARARNDTAELRRLAPALDDAESNIGYVLYASPLIASPLNDVDRMVNVRLERAIPRERRLTLLEGAQKYALERGRPGEALRLAEEAVALEGTESARRRWWRRLVIQGLYHDGDPAAADSAAAALARLARPVAGEATADDAQRKVDLCIAEHWRLGNGDTASVEATAATLESVPPGTHSLEDQQAYRAAASCALALRALAAVVADAPEAVQAVDRFDRHVGTGRVPGIGSAETAVLLARLWGAVGEPARALRALRRRSLGPLWITPGLLLQEGRLAALVGERDAAIRAYRHYLALRSHPEPRLQSEVQRVRADLARLSGERTGP